MEEFNNILYGTGGKEMKATEIQLFDWVKIPDKNAPYRRIWAIEYPFDNSVYVDDYRKEDSDDNYSITEIEPIPLTPEILEKNGFKFKGKFIYRDEEQGTEINLWLKNYGRDMPIEIYRNLDTNEEVCHTLPQCFLVHELQHALRLCHLADIADHFKI